MFGWVFKAIHGLHDNHDNYEFSYLELFSPYFKNSFLFLFFFFLKLQSHIFFSPLPNASPSLRMSNPQLYISSTLIPFLDYTKTLCFGVIKPTKFNPPTYANFKFVIFPHLYHPNEPEKVQNGFPLRSGLLCGWSR